LAEKKSLVPVVAKELRPHAIWTLIVWVGSLAGSAMIAALVALWQKLRHVSLDWLFIGGLFSLSFVVLALLLYLATKLSREHSKPHGPIVGVTTDNVELEPAPSTPAPHSEIKDSGNVSASGNTARATIGDINVYTAPSPVPRAAPLPRKEKVIHIEPPVPLHAKVQIDNEEMVWNKWHGPGGIQALLLPFYFDPNKSDSGVCVEYAKVHLEFTPDNPS